MVERGPAVPRYRSGLAPARRRHTEVALIQMPNGTGKTTTLQLLTATLTGQASAWDAARVRSFRQKGDSHPAGQFKATLLIDGKPLSIELTLDYDAGVARYKSTSPGSGGVVQRWNTPPAVRVASWRHSFSACLSSTGSSPIVCSIPTKQRPTGPSMPCVRFTSSMKSAHLQKTIGSDLPSSKRAGRR